MEGLCELGHIINLLLQRRCLLLLLYPFIFILFRESSNFQPPTIAEV
jgi:hypothetical protein